MTKIEKFIEKVEKSKVPQHIGIVMDGNGRWAKKRGKPRIKGHQAGVKTVRSIVEICGRLQIDYLTLYSFSTENWRRPKKEVQFVINLIENSLVREIDELAKSNVTIHFVGSKEGLKSSFLKKFERAYEKTKENTGLNLILAINYGGKKEIVDAANRIISQEKNPLVTEEKIDDNLYTSKFPDPDLIIRTSGEQRLSNFLVWQSAYSELFFTNTLWPDFNKIKFLQALLDFQKRKRRFGDIEVK